MSNRYTRITVPLSREEFAALSEAAQGDYRHPRDQARFIIRSVLLGEPMPVVSRKNADERPEAVPCVT